MNTLQTTIHDRMNQTGYNQDAEFYASEKIAFKKDGEGVLHTFNYLMQQNLKASYLELNELCIAFNDQFQDEKESSLTENQKQRLNSNGFSEVIDHEFNNEQLKIDFYPRLKGHYITDAKNNHYMLLSIQLYSSDNYSGMKLLKFTQPEFSFSLQDYYFEHDL